MSLRKIQTDMSQLVTRPCKSKWYLTSVMSQCVSRSHFQILKEYFGEREDFHKTIFLLYSFTQKTWIRSTSIIVKAVSTLTVQIICSKDKTSNIKM